MNRLEEKFLTKDKFSREAEEFMIKSNTTLMEAILEIAVQKNIEFELVKKYLTPFLIEKLEAEALENNLLVKKANKNTLPL